MTMTDAFSSLNAVVFSRIRRRRYPSARVNFPNHVKTPEITTFYYLKILSQISIKSCDESKRLFFKKW